MTGYVEKHIIIRKKVIDSKNLVDYEGVNEK